MSQNTSSAVMQQRSEAHDSLDDFPTPPWATRALCFRLPTYGTDTHKTQTVREPAANRGHMVRPLQSFFKSVDAFDIHDYGVGIPVRDYLFGPCEKVHWTITNPPFRLAEQFISKALQESQFGVAMLVRSAFLEGIGRYKNLFSKTPPTRVLQFTERVVMHKGKLSAKGSTATAYCWLMWDLCQKSEKTRFEWIDPCRKQMESANDYTS